MLGASTDSVITALAGSAQLRGFVKDGRIAAMPVKRSRRVLLLGEVAQAFEPGIRYPEPDVNRMLGAMFSDYCALRRYLVDEDFLSRADGEYWRSGGQVWRQPAHVQAAAREPA
jgi:hypothetical protein